MMYELFYMSYVLSKVRPGQVVGISSQYENYDLAILSSPAHQWKKLDLNRFNPSSCIPPLAHTHVQASLPPMTHSLILIVRIIKKRDKLTKYYSIVI